MGATPPEDRLNFWREDPLLNDHHDHWHDVYPLRNVEPVGDPREVGDRHGELFAYMHLQMLARYDAERLAVDLPRVRPLDDYRADIPEGYDPGNSWFFHSGNWYQFRPRPARAKIGDQPERRAQEIRAQEMRRCTPILALRPAAASLRIFFSGEWPLGLEKPPHAGILIVHR